MKSVFAVIGFIVVAIVVLAGAGIGYAIYKGGELDEEAQEYSQAAVAAITTNWSTAALRTRATPQLDAALGDAQLAGLFASFAALGPLQSVPACNGGTTVFADTRASRTVGHYTCMGQYKSGLASVQLALVRAAGKWSIDGFRVSSPLLTPAKPMQKA